MTNLLQPVEDSRLVALQERYLDDVRANNALLLDAYSSKLAPSSTALNDMSNWASIAGFGDEHDIPYLTLKVADVKDMVTKHKRSRKHGGDKYDMSTIRKRADILTGILRSAVRLGWYSAALYDDIREWVNDSLPEGTRPPKPQMDAVHKMLLACKDDDYGVRDAAVIALLGIVGLRRAEIVSLDVADVDMDAGVLKVVGKGSKTRYPKLANGALHAMSAYLAVRDSEKRALFVSRYGKRLSAESVRKIVAKRGEQAGVDVTPHDCRRIAATFIFEHYRGNLTHVLDHFGWSNPSTAKRYDYSDDAEFVESMERAWSNTTEMMRRRVA